jgi:hypothetical protein
MSSKELGQNTCFTSPRSGIPLSSLTRATHSEDIPHCMNFPQTVSSTRPIPLSRTPLHEVLTKRVVKSTDPLSRELHILTAVCIIDYS